MSVSFFEDTLYWLDITKGEGSINKAPVNNLSDVTVIEESLGGSLTDIQIYSKKKQGESTMVVSLQIC